MKRVFIILLLAVVLLASTAQAYTDTDLANMSTDELLALRAEINNEIAARYEPPVIEEGKTLIEIFPDEYLAKLIRDEIGLFSTKDQVSQDKLDKITKIWILNSDKGIKTIEGIQYLRNLEYLYIRFQESLHDIPEEIGSLQKLKIVEFGYSKIKSIPDSFCNLVNLEKLELYHTDIDSLPNDIGNLQSLKELNIGCTNIKELPASIYNLQLEEFGREGLDLD